jgi:hypothetical protein
MIDIKCFLDSIKYIIYSVAFGVFGGGVQICDWPGLSFL